MIKLSFFRSILLKCKRYLDGFKRCLLALLVVLFTTVIASHSKGTSTMIFSFRVCPTSAMRLRPAIARRKQGHHAYIGTVRQMVKLFQLHLLHGILGVRLPVVTSSLYRDAILVSSMDGFYLYTKAKLAMRDVRDDGCKI